MNVHKQPVSSPFCNLFLLRTPGKWMRPALGDGRERARLPEFGKRPVQGRRQRRVLRQHRDGGDHAVDAHHQRVKACTGRVIFESEDSRVLWPGATLP